VEQTRIFKRNRRLVGEALHQGDDRGRKFAGPAPLQNERTERALAAEQGNNETCAEARFDCGITQGIARPIEDVGHLQRLAPQDRLSVTSLPHRDVEFPKARDYVVIESGGLAELELAGIFAEVEDRAAIRVRKLYRAIDNGLQHDFEV